MNTSIMLVLVWFADIFPNTGGIVLIPGATPPSFVMPPPHVEIKEMPTMHMCESVGEWLQRLNSNVKYTCIEGPA